MMCVFTSDVVRHMMSTSPRSKWCVNCECVFTSLSSYRYRRKPDSKLCPTPFFRVQFTLTSAALHNTCLWTILSTVQTQWPIFVPARARWTDTQRLTEALLTLTVNTEQTWEIGPTLVYCWDNVVDGGQTVEQRWANFSCLPGSYAFIVMCEV